MVGLLIVAAIFVVCLVVASHLVLHKDFPLYASKYKEMLMEESIITIDMTGSKISRFKNPEIIKFESADVFVADNSFYLGNFTGLLDYMPTYCHPYSLYWYIKYRRLVSKFRKEGKIREL